MLRRQLNRFRQDEGGGALIEWALLVLFVTTASSYTTDFTYRGLERQATYMVKQLTNLNGAFHFR